MRQSPGRPGVWNLQIKRWESWWSNRSYHTAPNPAEILGLVFEEHAGHGKAGGVGDGKGHMCDSEPLGDLRGPPVELNCGPSAWFADNFDFQPTHPVAYAGSEGFGGCLFGGETRGEALSSVALAQAIGLFRRGIDPAEESLPIAVDRLPDALNFRQINSRTNNHPVYEAT